MALGALYEKLQDFTDTLAETLAAVNRTKYIGDLTKPEHLTFENYKTNEGEKETENQVCVFLDYTRDYLNQTISKPEFTDDIVNLRQGIVSEITHTCYLLSLE